MSDETGSDVEKGAAGSEDEKPQTPEPLPPEAAGAPGSLKPGYCAYAKPAEKTAPRLGNTHSTIVPYQAFQAKDGHVILAVGNNDQFERFAKYVGHAEWAEDERFARNANRVRNRDALVPMIAEIIEKENVEHWVEELHKVGVPCGPVNTMDKVFEMEQIQARDMQIEMAHPLSNDPLKLVGSPIKLSQTPVSYDHAPPVYGQHTEEILQNLLDLDAQDIAELKEKGIVDAASLGD